MSDATELNDIDRWLDGDGGWTDLAGRLGLSLTEAAAVRRNARAGALAALDAIRLRRRADAGEALAQRLLAERMETGPTEADEAVALRVQRMRGGGP